MDDNGIAVFFVHWCGIGVLCDVIDDTGVT
jgi:hypothetical protein